jgi:hypothetical protein
MLPLCENDASGCHFSRGEPLYFVSLNVDARAFLRPTSPWRAPWSKGGSAAVTTKDVITGDRWDTDDNRAISFKQ